MTVLSLARRANQSTRHFRVPGTLRIVIAKPAGSPAAEAYITALTPYADSVDVHCVDEAVLQNALADSVASAEILVASRPSPDVFAAARVLRWFSSWSAGVETVVTPELIARGIVVTNASGVHGPNIAEHVIGMMLTFTRGFRRFQHQQDARLWKRDWAEHELEELTGKTLLIVGLGRIGEALAVRAKAFDMRIIGVKRDPAKRHGASSTDAGRLGHSGSAEPSAIEAVVGFDGLDAALAQAHHVVAAVPATPDTLALFDAARFAHFRPDARFYNIARGAIVDEKALIAALRSERIAGAGLDVFADEPLPTDSPLWAMDNVIVSPHAAGFTPHYFQRAAALFAANVGRYLRGEALENRFQPERGY